MRILEKLLICIIADERLRSGFPVLSAIVLGYGFMMCAGKYLTKFKGFQENEYLAGYFSQAALSEQEPNNLVAGVDIGLNNLATVISNAENFKALLICGKALKSLNQQFNKKKAELQSKLKGKRKTSKKIQALSTKRNNKIDYYLHTASRFLINQCLQHNITHLIIGKNKQWKQSLNLGKQNNQSFTSIPHARFIEQLEYKAKLVGIKVTINEESYTSKCNFVDLEPIQKHSTYLGKRITRGLFTSSKGFKYNADCNGSGNIIRKVVGNSLFSQQDSIVRCVVHPVRVKPYKANTVDICLQN
jgi:putative transposase